MRARSLDDDDVVLVAPFDEEVAGESADFPSASKPLAATETNHNHVGHHGHRGLSEPHSAYTVSPIWSAALCISAEGDRVAHVPT